MEQRELTLAPESVGLRLDRWLNSARIFPAASCKT